MSNKRGHKWFAAFYERLVRMESKAEREARKRLLSTASGRVLEIGCGPGANFEYYPWEQITQFVTIEPDPYMLERGKKTAARLGRDVDLRESGAEDLPFPDDSFDTVIASLVLCTIPHPEKALAEMLRVLVPGGTLRFMEHVRSRNRLGALAQDISTPVWSWMAGGCQPNRDTEASIRATGFAITEISHPNLVPPVPPLALAKPMIFGTAIKPE